MHDVVPLAAPDWTDHLDLINKVVRRYRVAPGARVDLTRDYQPDDSMGVEKPENAREILEKGIELLCSYQERLFAENARGLLVIMQALDAAGKDSAIEHVMSGVNPAGCHVTNFKAPSVEELDHDYLWRCIKALPERGRIGIFNRSYYEEVLVVRVHPQFIAAQRLPPRTLGHGLWKQRFTEINNLERYLVDNGFDIVKIYLHVSKEEQKQRQLDRIEQPDKNWKFNAGDVEERRFWDDYRAAYEDVFEATSTQHAPWHVVPADKKWFTRIAVAAIIVHKLIEMDPQYPVLSDADRQKMLEARAKLITEDAGSAAGFAGGD